MSNFPPQMGGQMMQSRPPQNGNASAHIQQMIYTTLNQQTGPLSGWQVSVLVNERMGLIFNIIGNLRLASQHQPNPPTLQRMIEIGIRFEKEIFEKSPNKEHYKHQVQMKLEQLLERRNQNQASMQQQIQQQAQAQAQAQQAQAQQMMMNPNAMQGQGPRPLPQGGAQQGFSHLQHQMQASPIPGQQPPQAPMGMQNQGAQNMTPNQQQQFANAMQQGQSQQNLQGRMPNNGPQLSPQDNALVIDLTNRLSAQASEEEKAQLRNNLRQRMDAQQYAKYQSQGIDPVLLYFRNQAVNRLRQEKAMRVQQQQQVAMGQQPQNGPGSAQPMQQQRSMNPSPLNGQNPPPTTVGGNPDFGSFMGSMGDLAQQQAQGTRAQAGGEMVVPVSGAPRNATPQPGVMAGQNMAMNDQRGSANQNPNAQQRQSMLNAQQIQAQRLHHAQQQQQHQSQAQARMQAQVQAQQIALQGQVGGMGPGPVNTQPSPAMPTLNTPIRTPSQQQINQPENPTMNPNAQFGQPLDPRFMQGNQRQPNPGNAALTQAMYSQIPPEARETLSQMSPEKLNEVVSRWHAARLQQDMNPNGQGRPQMQLQGGGQVRPGQPMPQGGSFNPQNPAAQFMGGGQRPPGMAANMNPQQQLLLQQQIAALRPGQMPQRGPQNLTMEQRVTMQMDGVDVPQIYLNHQSMPQGVPPDIKKWGQLKQWVGTNTALGPNGLESVKNLQKHHYTNIIRSRQQNPQAGMMQPGMPGPPGMPGIPGVSAGMAAPVAPMGQNPVQMPAISMPNGLRQPTPQEIASLRNHPNGKMRNCTDDQIRQIFLRNNTAAQLHQQRQQQQLHQQSIMAAQMNRMGQQAPQPSVTVSNAATAAPPKPSQTPQPKPQPTPEPVSAPNNANASAARAARPQPNDRNAAQNSSPAQATKNLKRSSSSDEVIEVPNPNAQRPQPTAPNSQEGSQPSPARVTPQQIAALNPEQRKAYEVYIKKQQMNQANSRLQVNPLDLEKLKAIEKDEQQKSAGALPDLPLDEEYKNKMTAMMQGLVSSMQNVNKAMPRWFQITHNEERARQFFHTRFRFAKQFNDGETMQQLKGNFSITLQEVDSTKKLLNTIIQDLSSKFPNMKKQDGGKPAPTPTAQPAAQAPSQSSQPTPLNAANLQQQQQQLKMHQRSNSRSSHTPAAPTSEQPPIQFGGARSPHGAPSYLNNNTLTQERMHIPARKKQKQNSTPVAANGQGTPGSTASPKISKVMSPEMKRQAEAKSQTKSLTCPEPECERSNATFETQEALDMHRIEEHVKPLENPLRFVQESLTSVSGLDSQGYAKKVSNPDPVTNSAGATSGVKMMQGNSRQGNTPSAKVESASAGTTPMNRQVSMHRQSSAAGGKPNQHNGADSAKDANSKAKQSNDTKQEAPQLAPVDPWATATIDPTELSQFFQPFEAGAGGAISDMNVYRSITPNDTPESSKDGVSEPNSDISDGVALDINLDVYFDDSWKPFGPSDTDPVFDLDNFDINSGLDSRVMFDEDPIAGNFSSWDEMVDPSAFDKPFSFDTSIYSMNVD